MAKEETPKDITPMKRKGIDMAVKALSKNYPFVTGYKDDTSEQYQSAHYIDLFIDLKKLSEYMDAPINPYWLKEYQLNPDRTEKTFTLWSYLQFPNEDLNDIHNHPGYMLGKDLTELLDTIYEYFPDHYKLFYEVHYDWRPQSVSFPVNLKVNAYYHTLS